MKQALELLSSLKLAIVLLVMLLVGLAAGTIVESRANAAAAQQVVYFSWWFIALETLFAVNVLASVVKLAPWRGRLGFVVLHGALIVILAGALMTWVFKVEGTLGLWEGESGSVIEETAGGKVVAEHPLPFTVKLVDFQIDRYPGTMRPAMFRSLVEITESDTGRTYPAKIWMNHPLTVQGYTLFQSSYQQQGGREASVFSVSKDPGQPVVFVGYALLVLGMCIVLGKRIRVRRALARVRKRMNGQSLGRAAAALLLLGFVPTASAITLDDLDALRRLPVQHDGRTMAFDTLARETVWKVTGSRALYGQDPVATLAGWLDDLHSAAYQPVIPVGSDELALAMGLPGTRSVALAQLADSASFGRLVSEVRAAQSQSRALRGVHAAAEKLLSRAEWMGDLVSGELVRPVPVESDDPAARWGPAPSPGTDALVALAKGPRLKGWPAPQAIDREVTYNQVRPTRLAWTTLALSLALSLGAWGLRRRWMDYASAALLVAGFAVMTWGIAMRWLVAGRIPASNMYESLLFLGWGVGLFAVIAMGLIRNRLLLLNAAAGATITMMLTDLLPMDGFIHPMPPVLSGTPWLAIHVPIIMVGYAVLALGVVVAHMQIAFGALAPRKTELIETMADLNYVYIFVGSILLLAGILTGSVWAASSWGRYWGWDPKEVWSLVAFLAYMAVLHGRVDRCVGSYGVAGLSIVAFQTILMTYLGVNYVLGAGLHSYGFGDSPILFWMLLVALAEAAFLAWGWTAARRNELATAGAA